MQILQDHSYTLMCTEFFANVSLFFDNLNREATVSLTKDCK